MLMPLYVHDIQIQLCVVVFFVDYSLLHASITLFLDLWTACYCFLVQKAQCLCRDHYIYASQVNKNNTPYSISPPYLSVPNSNIHNGIAFET